MGKKKILDVGFVKRKMYDLQKTIEVSSRGQYGLAQLEDKYTIKPISLDSPNIIGIIINNFKCLESCDVLFMTFFYRQPLVLLSFLRLIGLFRKRKIVVISHVSLAKGKSVVEKFLLRCIYSSIDVFLFHSSKNLDESVEKGLISKRRGEFLYWGDDLDYIDRHFTPIQHNFFLSTGCENRDFSKLISVFSKTQVVLDIYTNKINYNNNYEYLESYLGTYPNIHVNFVEKSLGTTHVLTKRASECFCIVIPLIQKKVTNCLGLTSLIEAMALGKPVISSRNPYYPIDIEKEGIGIIADDEESWVTAINYLVSHPDEAKQMGVRARQLAERKYNIKECAKQIDKIFSASRHNNIVYSEFGRPI